MISNLNELVQGSQASVVEFVHVTRDHPWSACSERVTVSIDGNWVTLKRGSLRPGGNVWFDDDYNEHVEQGPWTIYDNALPEHLSHLKSEVERVINENVSGGCCGGCV